MYYRCLVALFVGLAFLVQFPSQSLSQTLGAKISVHVVPAQNKACDANAPAFDCAKYNTLGVSDATPHFIYIVAVDDDPLSAGISGVKFGVEHSGFDYVGWTRCGALDFRGPDFPEVSPSGIIVTWDRFSDCQESDYGSGVQAITGFLYTYTSESASLQLRTNPTDGLVDLADCNLVQGDLIPAERLGRATFGTSDGCNPCVESCVPGTGDTDPPVLLSAQGGAGRTSAVVVFNEFLAAGAEDPDNFTLDPAVGVLSASAREGRVRLELDAPLASTTLYTVTVSNVEDLTGNPVAPGSEASFMTGTTAFAEAKIALHVGSTTSKACTDNSPASLPCSQFVVDMGPPSQEFPVYLIAAQADPVAGFSGVQVALQYPPTLTLNDWTSCADSDLPETAWPASGTSIIVFYDPIYNCQTNTPGGDGAQAVLGWFSVGAYGAGDLGLVPPAQLPGDVALLTDCEPRDVEVPRSGLGRVSIGTQDPGCNPCLISCAEPISVEPRTWGSIKKQFRESR